MEDTGVGLDVEVEAVRRDYGNGLRYEGSVRADGVFHGKGTARMSYAAPLPGSGWGGWEYVGEWVAGKKHGQGTYSALPPSFAGAHPRRDGGEKRETEEEQEREGTAEDAFYPYRYAGGWVDDRMSGMGTEDCESGTYSGSWHAGKRQGLGTFLHRETQDMYIGQWEDGLEHGKGREVEGDTGDVQEGDWRHGLLHGRGRMVQKDGYVVYDGMWVEGAREGHGILLVRKPEETEEEEESVGQQEQQASGSPVIIRVTRDNATTIYEGQWKDDRWHGEGKLTTRKAVYSGGFVDGRKHGHGSQTTSTTSYAGQWLDGAMHGQGRFVDLVTGDTYDGEWKAGKRHGHGLYTLSQDAPLPTESPITFAATWIEGAMVPGSEQPACSRTHEDDEPMS